MDKQHSNFSYPSTIDRQEVEKFSLLADLWWDLNGPYKILHQINPLRISYIKNCVADHLSLTKGISLEAGTSIFSGLKFLDIGSGGGLLTVPMRRLGAEITGIDASSQNIEAAKLYAANHKLDINYLHTSVEELAAQPGSGKFDVVLCVEIIEHVADLPLFLEKAISLLREGGLIVISTINRTLKSVVQAIALAEYLLYWVPKGTHDWKKFVAPAEVTEILQANSVQLRSLKGIGYNLFTLRWRLIDSVKVNYILCGVKQSELLKNHYSYEEGQAF